MILFSMLTAVFIGRAVAQQQQDDVDVVAESSFCTPTPTNESSSSELLTMLLDQIQGVRIGREPGGSCAGETILEPTSMHWHIYSLPNDSSENEQSPRIAMYPPNIVQTKLVDENILLLQIQSLDRLTEFNTTFAHRDPIKVGVALWLPAQAMSTFQINLSGSVVSIVYHGTEPLRVDSAGINNKVLIQSLQAPVFYEASGIRQSATILATGSSGSSIQMSGIDPSLRIAVPSNTTMNDDDLLQVTMTGKDAKARVVGDYGSLSVSNGDEVIVDTSCASVVSSGPDVYCSVDTNLEITAEDLQLSCLVDTHISTTLRTVCPFNWRGAIIGIVTGASIGITLCVGGVYWLTCRSRRNRANKSKAGDMEEGKALPAIDEHVIDS